MKKLVLIISAMALPFAAHAAPCKDAKGKFTKCPPAAAAPAKRAAKPLVTTAMRPAKAVAHAKKTPCRDAKGRFAKCAK